MDILQATLQKKDAKIQKLQQHITYQKVLIEQQTADLYQESALLIDVGISLEQLILAKEEQLEDERKMRLNEREAHYLQKHAEELMSIQFHPQKVCSCKHAVVVLLYILVVL